MRKIADTFTRDQRSQIVSDTITKGVLGQVFADMITLELDLNVPETMPKDFTYGLALHINPWLRNVEQRRHVSNPPSEDIPEYERLLDYLWAILQMLTMRGYLKLHESGGYPYYELRRNLCNVCEEVHQ